MQILLGEIESDFGCRDFSYAIRIEWLTGSQANLFFGLFDCGFRLFELCRRLLDAKFQFSVVESHQHLPALHATADVDTDGDDFARCLWCNVSLLVADQAAGRFEEARQIASDSGRSRDFNDGRLSGCGSFLFPDVGA
jgi:hypothetical protein